MSAVCAVAALMVFPGTSGAASPEDLGTTVKAVGDVVSKVSQQATAGSAPAVKAVVETVAPTTSKVVGETRSALRDSPVTEPVTAVADAALARVAGAADVAAPVSGGQSEAPRTTAPASSQNESSGSAPAERFDRNPAGAPAGGAEPVARGRDSSSGLVERAGAFFRAAATDRPAQSSSAPAAGLGERDQGRGLGEPTSGVAFAGSVGSGLAGGLLVAALALLLPSLLSKRLPRLSASWGPVAFLEPIERPG